MNETCRNEDNGQFTTIVLDGKRFGKVTVLPIHEKTPNGGTKWKYRCDCGVEGWAWAETLKRQTNFSCPECRKVRIGNARKTHGMRNTPEYRVWVSMKDRCNNPNHKSFKDYGGRGIKVCGDWHNFLNFFEDMGKRPDKGMTIERKDNTLGYFKDNCIWATVQDQANNRRSNRFIEHNGKKQTISQWSRELGIHKATIKQRLNKGWPVEKILSLDKF